MLLRLSLCLLSAALVTGGCKQKEPEMPVEYFPVAPKPEPTVEEKKAAEAAEQEKRRACGDEPPGTECGTAEQLGTPVVETTVVGKAPKAVEGQIVPGTYVLTKSVKYEKKKTKHQDAELTRPSQVTIVVTKEGETYSLLFVENAPGCPPVNRRLSGVIAANGMFKASQVCPKCTEDCEVDVELSVEPTSFGLIVRKETETYVTTYVRKP